MGRKRKNRPDLPARVTFEHGAYYFRRAADHKRIRLGREYPEAMKAWANLLQQTNVTQRLSSIMDAYLVSDMFLELKPRTQQDYHDAIRRLRPVFGEMYAEDLEPKHIYGYMRRRNAPVRANREKATLSNVLQLAIELGYINKNPCKEVKRNEENPREREVLDEEVTAVLAYCPAWLKAYITLKSLTGLRQGDMLRLTLHSIKENGLFVPTSKNGKRMLFLWSDELLNAVEAVRAIKRPIHSIFLFNSNRGTQLSESGFKTAWSRAMNAAIKAKALTERFAENDLRAKVATDAHDQGQDATALLGHSSNAVTQRHYIRGTRKVKPLK